MDPSVSLVDSKLLEKIDALFACKAGEYVDLPQLVVVGQQSSGKSSVLEGLTGLPFPRDSSLCTRFATQITFRRSTNSTDSKISACIIPADHSSDEHRANVAHWRREESGSLDSQTFSEIMREVVDVMGVSSSRNQNAPAFSKDVLALEISGPDQEHFSVIDVPGTFKRTTLGVTTKADIDLVDGMVRGYMANSRSVMLTVVPCNSDIANQDIIELAEDLDPEGDRTLGILTKPDLVDKGAEEDIVALINKRKHQLKLGWHLLRNPGQADGFDTRDTKEQEFFRSVAPWNELDKEQVGIKALRVRLQGVLASHVRREFPKVRKEILQRLKKAKRKLEILGAPRQNQAQQSRFLTSIAADFQQLANCAARAQYAPSDFFGDEDNCRLATVAMNRGETFAKLMSISGHQFEFSHSESTDAQTDEGYEEEGEDEDEGQDDEEEDFESRTSADSSTRLLADHEDITDIVSEQEDVLTPRQDDIHDWLKKVYKRSRGFELGTFDSSLLLVTMQQQAKKWQDIAKGYISDMIVLVHKFVLKLLEHLVPDKRTLESLTSLLSEDLREKYVAAMGQVDFLLKIELEGTPATYNRVFSERLNKFRQERLKGDLEHKAVDGGKLGAVVRLEDIVHSHPLSNNDQMVQEIHDILRSYYELSRERFVDNIRMQAADHFLVTGPSTPLKLFSPQFVADLTESQLEEVAGEEIGVKRIRASLDKEVRLLEVAMRIIK